MGNCRTFKWSVTLTLTLDRVKVIWTCTIPVVLPRVQPCDCVVTQYRNMAIWMSWNIDIPWSLNSCGSFPRRKFENRPHTSYRPGPILSSATISFELHAKVAEEIDLEMCSYGQLSDVQTVRDLDLDLGWGQRHITIYSTCRNTSLQSHVAVVVAKYGNLNFVKYRHTAKFELSW